MKLWPLLILPIVSSGFVAAAGCPQGASDCFLCGTLPCTKDCTGSWSKAAGDYVSCECPQGKACACYCPYIPKMSEECALDPSCTLEKIPSLGAAMGYIAKFSGKPAIIKAGTGKKVPITQLTVINDGDTIQVADGERVYIMFPGGNLRSMFGECDITITKEDEALTLSGPGKYWVATMPLRIIEQIVKNRGSVDDMNKHAMTVNGLPEGALMDDTHSLATRKYYAEHPEELHVEYDIHSEAIFEITRKSQTVKVVEGSVTAKNIGGEKVNIESGEEFTARNVNDFKKPDVKPYDYHDDEAWWSSGFSQKCEMKCPSGQEQTPYPGCSCTAASQKSQGCCAPAMTVLIALVTAVVTKRLSF